MKPSKQFFLTLAILALFTPLAVHAGCGDDEDAATESSPMVSVDPVSPQSNTNSAES
jgi:hypothetical protein